MTSPTLTNAMLNEGDFLVIRLDLVRALGGDLETAVVLQRIAWRCERDGEWRATWDQIREETGISEWKARRSLKRLRDLGWVTSKRTSKWDATPVWTVEISDIEDSSVSGVRNPQSRDGGSLSVETEVLSVTETEESSVSESEDSSVSSLQKRRDSSSSVEDIGDTTTWTPRWNPSNESKARMLAVYPELTVRDQMYLADKAAGRVIETKDARGMSDALFEAYCKTEAERRRAKAAEASEYDKGYDATAWRTEVAAAVAYYGSRGLPLPDKYKQEGTTTT